ncbi:MAG TPA: HigA family addiction module antitoxin [Xanthobacteraceae bacterium]|nr:HigA family addiction module antitoxin [Xanthobacteraceae bacterium]
MSTLSNITDSADILPMAKSQPAPERKRAPSHPGEVIADILEDIGVSARSAAAAMGVSHNALANVIRGDTGVSAEMAVRLGAYMANGPRLWLDLQSDFDLWHAEAKLKNEVAKIKPAPREPKVA